MSVVEQLVGCFKTCKNDKGHGSQAILHKAVRKGEQMTRRVHETWKRCAYLIALQLLAVWGDWRFPVDLVKQMQ